MIVLKRRSKKIRGGVREGEKKSSEKDLRRTPTRNWRKVETEKKRKRKTGPRILKSTEGSMVHARMGNVELLETIDSSAPRSTRSGLLDAKRPGGGGKQKSVGG